MAKARKAAKKKPAKKRATPTADDRLREIERMSVDMVYHDAVKHEETRFFRRLGLSSTPTLRQFRAKYIHRGKADHTRLMSDVWNYEPIAQRWRKDMDERGFTVEWFLHQLVDLLTRAERLGPDEADPKEVAKLREMRDEVLSKEKIRKH
jgi:hypothetical protein